MRRNECTASVTLTALPHLYRCCCNSYSHFLQYVTAGADWHGGGSRLREPVPEPLQGIPEVEAPSSHSRAAAGRRVHLVRSQSPQRGRVPRDTEAHYARSRADWMLSWLPQRGEDQGKRSHHFFSLTFPHSHPNYPILSDPVPSDFYPTCPISSYRRRTNNLSCNVVFSAKGSLLLSHISCRHSCPTPPNNCLHRGLTLR